MNMKKFMKVALGAGLFLLDQPDHAKKSVRERVSGHVDDLRDMAQDTYLAAADRIASASKAFRKEDNRALWHTLRFIAGVGIGVGVGLLLVPANGEETRTKLAEKAQEFGDNLRQHFTSGDSLRATTMGD
jgi:hypothetical protein